MYKFLSSIRESSVVAKIGISLLLLLFSSLLGLLVYWGLIIKSMQTNPERYKYEIEKFKKHYDELRPFAKDSSDPTICIGNYMCEYEGKLFVKSKFLSIHAKNICDSVVYSYHRIERRTIENETYYQFPIKKRYSKTEKLTIIFDVLRYIEKNYPDDSVMYDDSIPMGYSGVDIARKAKVMGIEM